jgi:hypothetical protein
MNGKRKHKLLETLVVCQLTTIRNPTLLEVVIVEPIDARKPNEHALTHTHKPVIVIEPWNGT